MITDEQFKEAQSIVEQYTDQLRLYSVSRRFTLDELKEIMFRYEMKYHIFKPDTTKEFTQEEIERFTKYHIADWLQAENVC